jgi:hypothetical protein
MKDDRHAKLCAMLDAEEGSLRARLLAILPDVAAGGTQLFVNSTNLPETTARYSHEEANELFTPAQRIMALRGKLGLDTQNCVSDHFLIACQEAASSDPHRRGPRKLAEWLLTKITS